MINVTRLLENDVCVCVEYRGNVKQTHDHPGGWNHYRYIITLVCFFSCYVCFKNTNVGKRPRLNNPSPTPHRPLPDPDPNPTWWRSKFLYITLFSFLFITFVVTLLLLFPLSSTCLSFFSNLRPSLLVTASFLSVFLSLSPLCLSICIFSPLSLNTETKRSY